MAGFGGNKNFSIDGVIGKKDISKEEQVKKDIKKINLNSAKIYEPYNDDVRVFMICQAINDYFTGKFKKGELYYYEYRRADKNGTPYYRVYWFYKGNVNESYIETTEENKFKKNFKVLHKDDEGYYEIMNKLNFKGYFKKEIKGDTPLN